MARGGTLDYQNRIMATLFYEPSTRTRFSFEAAMYRLGGRVLSTEQARLFSSEVEGEQLEDTIRIIGGYSDVIVHPPHAGGRREAGRRRCRRCRSSTPATATAASTRRRRCSTCTRSTASGRLDGLSIAIIGELDRGRTARSLAYLLSKFERVKIYFVSPPEMQMKPDILEHLDEHDVWYALESRHRPR